MKDEKKLWLACQCAGNITGARAQGSKAMLSFLFRKTDHAPLVPVKASEVDTVTATIVTNPRLGGAVVKEEVATETETQ